MFFSNKLSKSALFLKIEKGDLYQQLSTYLFLGKVGMLMSNVCEQDEEAVDMEDFIDSGGLEEDTNTLELPDQQHSKVR
jgi:hypothetical protein